MKRVAGALVALVAGLAASGMAADSDAPSRELAEAIAGRVAGAPESCVDSRRLLGPERIDQRHLVYRQNGQRLWVNTLRDRCQPLVGDNILVFDNQFGTQLCERDRFMVQGRNGGFSAAYCFLGKFTPYDKPPAPKR
ncbi:MAG: hypothetical protein K2X76_16385 [Sphingomonas sp.]|nr:hypothetical protein [Sphingomonas sp.]